MERGDREIAGGFSEHRLFLGGPVVVFRWVAEEGWSVEYVSPNVQQLFEYSAEEFMKGIVP